MVEGNEGYQPTKAEINEANSRLSPDQAELSARRERLNRGVPEGAEYCPNAQGSVKVEVTGEGTDKSLKIELAMSVNVNLSHLFLAYDKYTFDGLIKHSIANGAGLNVPNRADNLGLMDEVITQINEQYPTIINDIDRFQDMSSNLNDAMDSFLDNRNQFFEEARSGKYQNVSDRLEQILGIARQYDFIEGINGPWLDQAREMIRAAQEVQTPSQ